MSTADQFSRIHERLVLRHPIAVLAVGLFLLAIFGWHARHFGLDASADSLTLERDESLRYYRATRARYGTDDYLIVTFAPRDNLFGDFALEQLHNLRRDLRSLDEVESVVSILDVPLIKSPPANLREISGGIRRLEDPTTDRQMARRELINSPLYRDLLISADASITALQVNLRQDEDFVVLRDLRDRLREREYFGTLTEDEARTLSNTEAQFETLSRSLLDEERHTISAVRSILDSYKDVATLHIGGVPMIVADSIEFIRHDLVTFSVAVIAFLIGILLVAF